jgi:cytochrome c-type biogenesis protein CcmH/NrfG
MNPDNPKVWISLSEVYLERKNYDNCLRALNNIYYLPDSKEHLMKPSKNPAEILFKE